MLSKDRCKTTAGFFVIPLLSQLWEEKNYWERRNELSSWRSVALPNRHIHLYLFKLGYDVHALLSSVMYILSGENITAMFTISRRRWDQNTTQVANRLDKARATYVRLLHVPPWLQQWVFWSRRSNWICRKWRGLFTKGGSLSLREGVRKFFSLNILCFFSSVLSGGHQGGLPELWHSAGVLAAARLAQRGDPHLHPLQAGRQGQWRGHKSRLTNSALPRIWAQIRGVAWVSANAEHLYIHMEPK